MDLKKFAKIKSRNNFKVYLDTCGEPEVGRLISINGSIATISLDYSTGDRTALVEDVYYKLSEESLKDLFISSGFYNSEENIRYPDTSVFMESRLMMLDREYNRSGKDAIPLRHYIVQKVEGGRREVFHDRNELKEYLKNESIKSI